MNIIDSHIDSLITLYQRNIELLTLANITYREWKHEPILDFATDEKVAQQLGWTGTHSKSLFLKTKAGDYALYLTEKDKRLDSKAIKSVLGKRVSICKDEEMIEQLDCVPGAVCPFGIPQHVEIIIDCELLEHQELLYTPGLPEYTLGFSGAQLKVLAALLPNQVHWL